MAARNRVAIVTGGTRGIGRAVAHRLASEGYDVVLSGRTSQSAEEAAISLRDEGASVRGVGADVRREEDQRRLIQFVEQEFGRLDVLVNNAGIIAYEPLGELDIKAWTRVIAVNQTGVFLGMREAIRVMRPQKSGSIVNFSSIWGNAAVGGAHAYHATKGAVRNMTKNAAMTYVADGIRVNSVHPGFIDTPLTQAQAPEINAFVIASTPMKRAGQPIEVANGCLFLASDESSYMTGAELVIDGGYLAQ
jgi:NAD(P)-dependent dehydrogenase (short-subunit alcohol dehydrogenase family)